MKSRLVNKIVRVLSIIIVFLCFWQGVILGSEGHSDPYFIENSLAYDAYKIYESYEEYGEDEEYEDSDVPRYFTDTVEDTIASGTKADEIGKKLGLDRLKESILSSSKTVIVAVLDTGVDTSNTVLADHLMPGYDAVDEDFTYIDTDGHGTFVSGVIAMNTPSNVKIMPINVFDEEENTLDSVLVKGIYYAVKHGASVINLSLGGNGKTRYLEKAIQYAIDNEVLVIASSGNDANDMGSYYPASFEEVITVGATGINGDLLYYSNTGEDLDLCAPGEKIVSTYLNNTLTAMSGTSMAAPFVSAAAAMLCLEEPEVDIETVRKRLLNHTQDLGSIGWDSIFGIGEIEFNNYKSNQDFYFIDFPKEGIAPEYKFDLSFAYFLGDSSRKISVTIDDVDFSMTSTTMDDFYKSYLDIRSLSVGVHHLKLFITNGDGTKEILLDTMFNIPEYNVRIKCVDEYNNQRLYGWYSKLLYKNNGYRITEVEKKEMSNGMILLNIDFSKMKKEEIYRIYANIVADGDPIYLRVIGLGGEKVFSPVDSNYYFFYQTSDYTKDINFYVYLNTHATDEYSPDDTYNLFLITLRPDFGIYPGSNFDFEYIAEDNMDKKIGYRIIDHSDLSLTIAEYSHSREMHRFNNYLYYSGKVTELEQFTDLDRKKLMEVIIDPENLDYFGESINPSYALLKNKITSNSITFSIHDGINRLFVPKADYGLIVEVDSGEGGNFKYENYVYGITDKKESYTFTLGNQFALSVNENRYNNQLSCNLTDEYNNFVDVLGYASDYASTKPILILQNVQNNKLSYKIDNIYVFNTYPKTELIYSMYGIPDGIYSYWFETKCERIDVSQSEKNKTITIKNGSMTDLSNNKPSMYSDFYDTIPTGGTTIIDLNGMFYDIDGDKLTYEVDIGYIIDHFLFYEDTINCDVKILIKAFDGRGGYIHYYLPIRIDDTYDLDSSIKPIGDIVSIGASQWAKESIAKAVKDNIVEVNILDNYQVNLTREQMCQQIVKALEQKNKKIAFSGTNQFYDTENEAVLKANAASIVKGVSKNLFAPYDYITRQQFCLILFNVAKYLQPSLVADKKLATKFVDEASIAAWAKDGVTFCVNRGIMKGIDGKIQPNGNITREQAITMLVRFFEK